MLTCRLNFFALAMDNFGVVSSIANFATTLDENGRAQLAVKNISLEQGEGVNLERSKAVKKGTFERHFIYLCALAVTGPKRIKHL